MKYYYYIPIVFTIAFGSCSQQKQVTKTPAPINNTVTANTVPNAVQMVNSPAKTHWDTFRISPKAYYEDAFEKLKQMLNGEQPQSFKRAVYITENAWFENKLPYDAYNNYIKSLANVCTVWKKANPLLHYDWDFDSIQVALNGAIYHIMTDTVKETKGTIVSTPYHYDFNDCFAKDDWTNMFVAKLMATHRGNCHSLPFLYKILAEELGTSAYLCMLPEHIYINQYARKTSWYNTELTGRCFPIDAWLMTTGYVSAQSIRTGLYMDTLSLSESIGVCVNDLAKGYQRKFGDGDYNFVLKCCDLGLKYYPTYGELCLLKAETLKKMYESAIAKYGLNAPDSKEYGDTIHAIYSKMEQAYNRLAKLDYHEIPEALYRHWTEAMINGGKQQNEDIHDTVVYTTIAGKRQGIITYSYGDYAVLFNPLDTLRRIGSVIFNTKRHRVEYFILKNDETFSAELSQPTEPARFLSVDSKTKQFPDLSPYQYAGNTPIQAIDLDGREPLSMIDGQGQLTSPIISLLKAAFNYSDESLTSTYWIKGTPPHNAEAITDLNIVHYLASNFLNKNGNPTPSYNKDWFSLIAHEQTHRDEIGDVSQHPLSSLGWYVGYGAAWVAGGFSYSNDTYEKRAYANGDLADELYNKYGDQINSVLQNSHFLVEQKEVKLTIIGTQFKLDKLNEGRDAQLAAKKAGQQYSPDSINYYNQAIKQTQETLNSLKEQDKDLDKQNSTDTK